MSLRSFLNAMDKSEFVSDNVLAGTCPICKSDQFTIFIDVREGDSWSMRHTCGCTKSALQAFIDGPDHYQPAPVDPQRDEKRTRFWSLMWRLDDLSQEESLELAELHIAVEEGRI